MRLRLVCADGSEARSLPGPGAPLDDRLPWLSVGALCAYSVGFCVGMGPVPWFMLAELVPRPVQHWANSAIVLYTHSLTFLVTKCFTGSVDGFGTAATFFFFSLVCFLGIAFIYMFVPETKNRTAAEIQIAINLGPKQADEYFAPIRIK